MAKKIFILTIIIILCIVISLSLGRYPVSFKELILLLFSADDLDKTVKIVLLTVRLPRVLTALFVGAALAGSGAVYQTIFRNPMVSPSVLGASSGAAFGAVLALLLEFNQWFVQLFSFISGVGAVLLALIVASTGRLKNRTLLLVLSGMLVSTFFTALISMVKFLADPQNTLPTITYWLMGSMAESELSQALFMGVVVIISATLLYIFRWRITIISLNDEEALSMGVNPERFRFIVVLFSTLLTSAAVSICGIIGWVGLVVPHIVRFIIPNNFGRMFSVSLLVGALYLLLIDTIIRVISPIEFPLGVLTSLIGAPFFAMFLLRREPS